MTVSRVLRRIGTLVAAATVAVTCLVTEPDNAATAQGFTPRPAALYRVTLIVSNIERSMDFYRRLGFVSHSDTARATGDATGIIAGDSLPLAADPTRSRLVVMTSEGNVSGAIALLWYDRPPLPSARGNLMGVGTGDVVLMLQVADIQAVYASLDSVSTRFHEPLAGFTSRETGTEPQGGRRVLAYDPDGHMVEITQFD